ncbi:hypothetical protein CSC12_3186 [Klebsiella michiganensis]|nr:hypothetical protein CSC12_3186 [Klebsiella michiganensis]
MPFFRLRFDNYPDDIKYIYCRGTQYTLFPHSSLVFFMIFTLLIN